MLLKNPREELPSVLSKPGGIGTETKCEWLESLLENHRMPEVVCKALIKFVPLFGAVFTIALADVQK